MTELLQKSISVVACNKIACSSPYGNYRKLKDLAREFNARFLFETNVGAGLPVIGTLNDLLRSGDKVHRIEAVFSGTLNFVFNNYNGERPFSQVVNQAQDEGYTEPDPRLDLSGTDVMRKIMILARESGEKIEMEDITNTSFMPASCMQGSVEDFYEAMVKEEDHFQLLYESAAKEEKKLKFVARYDNGKASVGLQHIGPAAQSLSLVWKRQCRPLLYRPLFRTASGRKRRRRRCGSHSIRCICRYITHHQLLINETGNRTMPRHRSQPRLWL